MRLRLECLRESPASYGAGEMGAAFGSEKWVVDFQCYDEHFPVSNPKSLDSKGPVLGVLRWQFEIGVSPPFQKKAETGER